jgi:uncharacterized protein (TIGR03032 family)
VTRRRSSGETAALWDQHDRDWRHPAEAATRWPDAAGVDPRLLRCVASRDWWDLLESLRVTLLVSREYEHLLLALRSSCSGPEITYFPLPHPSGLAVDRDRLRAYVASTRNPNQVYEFGGMPTLESAGPLLPLRSWFLPGQLYIHDLALIGGELYANAVGENAVVALPAEGGYVRRWWPRAIETEAGPVFGPNYLQLNSIAAGAALEASFFSASTDTLSHRRPGHQNFVVDRRGVIFSGATREPIARGLTRPHSARLHAGRLWVDNSGYGEFGSVCDGRFEPLARLTGWTRGLAFCEGTAFVGTSRVLPRFRQYAPGVDLDRSECAVHAVDWSTGKRLASLRWPAGNQLFAIDWLPRDALSGLPFGSGTSTRAARKTTDLFYTYRDE